MDQEEPPRRSIEELTLRAPALHRPARLVGDENLLGGTDAAGPDEPCWSYPGLNDPQRVEGDAARLRGEGVWGDRLEPCRFVAAIGDRADPAVLTEIARHGAILQALAHLPQVPRLLRLDIAGAMLVHAAPAAPPLCTWVPLAAPTVERLRRICDVALALADLLEAMHGAGIVHAHLRPEVVHADESGGPVFVTDFAGARLVAPAPGARPPPPDAWLPPPSRPLGPHDAPEHTGRLGDAVDTRADLYGLGAVILHAATGAPAFPTGDPLDLLHAVLTRPPPRLPAAAPPEWAALVEQLLAKDPRQRPASAAEVRAALLRVRARLDGAAPMPGRVEPAPLPAGCGGGRRIVGWARQRERLRALVDEMLELADLVPGAAALRLATIAGEAGAGKSTLLAGVLEGVGQRGAVVAQVQCAAAGEPVPHTSILERLVASVAEHWLSDEAAALERVRAALRRRLGGASHPPGAAMRAWAALIGPSDSPQDSPTPPIDRLADAVREVLAESRQPLIAVVDDLHLATQADREAFERWALAPGCGPLLVLVGQREPASRAPAVALLPGLEAAAVRPLRIVLDRLDADGAAALVAEALGAPVQEVDGLARQLSARSTGRPGDLLRRLDALRADGALVRRDGRWACDPARLAALPVADASHLERLAHHAQLPEATRRWIGAVACAGPGAQSEVTAAEVPPEVSPDLLVRLGLLRPAIGRDGQTTYGLADERLREELERRLDPVERARAHLAIARRLRARRGDSDPLRIGRHYVAAAAAWAGPRPPQPLAEEERRAVAALIDGSAERIAAQDGVDEAMRWLDMADRCDGAGGVARDAVRHGLLVDAGRDDEAEMVWQRLARACPRQAWSGRLVHERGVSLRRRGAPQAAIALALEVLVHEGVTAPDDALLEAAADELAGRLRARLGSDVAAACDALPARAADGPAARRGAAWCVAADAADGRRPALAAWARRAGLADALVHGMHPSLWRLLLGCVPLDDRPDGHARGVELAQAGLRLCARASDPRLAAEAAWRKSRFASAWFEPLERTLMHARRSCEAAQRAGSPVPEAEAWIARAPLELECATHLGDAHRWLAGMPATAGSAVVDRYREALDGLRSGSNGASATVPAAEAGEDDPAARVHVATLQALAALLRGDERQALAFSRAAAASLRHVDGQFVGFVQRWVHAVAGGIAAVGASAARRAELDLELAAPRQWLARRAGEVPANFGHGDRLARAVAAWSDGDASRALPLFEAAIDGALRDRRPGPHALACALAARCLSGLGIERAAAAYREAARLAFEAWGYGLAPAGASPAAEATPGGPAAAIDAEVIAQASQALARQRDPDGMARLLFELVRRYAAVERGVLFWQVAGRWTPRAGFEGDRVCFESDSAASAGWGAAPQSVLRYLSNGGRPLLLRDVANHPRFASDPLLAGGSVLSVIGLPIRHRGSIAGLLYLENRQAASSLGPVQLQTLELIGLQFAIAYENAHVYRDLEATVERRTEDLRRENLERRRAEQAAEAASRAKGDFLASMSHELRTPLNAILGFADLIERDAALTPASREAVRIVAQSGHHLLALINQVLDLAKVESGRLQLEPRAIDLRELVDRVLEMMSVRARQKGLRLDRDEAPGLPRFVRIDDLKLRQVLINLIGNAIKFTERGQVTLHVGGRQNGGRWLLRFEVADSGVGMSAEELTRLFDAFTQGEAGRRQREGTGLGLVISRRFVELMGGAMEVESEPGGGSRFRFELPAEPAGRADRDPAADGLDVVALAPHQPGHVGPDARRMLIVEDNDANRLWLERLMTGVGFDVRHAYDGRAAVTAYAEQLPRFVWMDLSMPVMDGIEAMRAIRRQPGGEAARIVCVTASAGEDERARLLAAGFDGVLFKPLRPAALFELLHRLLGVEFIHRERGADRSRVPDAAGMAFESLGDAVWRDAFREAASLGDVDRLQHLVDRLPDDAAVARERLQALLDGLELAALQQAAAGGTVPGRSAK